MAQTIQKEYQMPLEITSYDVGAENQLRLSAVLRYQQEAAERQLAPLGLGWSALVAQGMVFVTSRWHARVFRLPIMGEKVTLTTWHRERKGPRFLRCYEWRDEKGDLLLDGVMQFALVSVEGHRLLRGEEFDAFGLPALPERGVDCADPAKFRMPPLSPQWDMTVRWSHTDRNGHMNNTRYADLLCDALPDGMGRPMADVQLYFAGESRPGEVITLSAATEDGVDYVRGTVGERTVFEGRVTFSEEAR